MRFENEKLQRLLERALAEKPGKADAIVWLQGDRLDRGPKALELFSAGFAPTILITGNNALIGVGPRSGENDAPLADLVAFLTEHGVPREAIFVGDTAMNTADQAKNIVAFARERGWRNLILVSSPYHQVRAYLTFEKAKHDAGAAVAFINQPATDLAWDANPSGRNKTARELLADEEQKIFSYGIVGESI